MSESTSPAPEAQTSTPAPEAELSDRVKSRLAEVTKERRTAERKAEAATAENVELKAQLSALQNQVATLSQPAPSKDPLEGLFGAKPAATPAPTSDVLGAQIKAAVNDALSPILEHQKSVAEQEQLLASQERVFADASADLPNVKIQGSTEQQLFAQIWEANPEIQRSVNGPAIVIQSVRGILADGETTTAEADAKKRAAAIPSPAGAPQQRLDNVKNAPSKTAEVLSQVKDKMRRGDHMSDEEMDFYWGSQFGSLTLKE